MSTALDRYRDAKLALDTFDAFTKGMMTAEPHHNAERGVKLIVMGRVETDCTMRSPRSQTIKGFNEFIGAFITGEREALAKAYRITLVEAVRATHKQALLEAQALFQEEPPA